jgi:formate hydrogenlyase subunit 6/NADH:ubiquinone oxidoreductase subunit I
LILSGDCTGCAESCFCTMLGDRPYPDQGFDLNLSPTDRGYLVQVGSPRGEAIVAAHAALFRAATEAEIQENQRRRAAVEERVRHQNRRFPTRDPFAQSVEKNLKTRIWGDLAATCVECNACNYACPTCHCFLFRDGVAQRAGGDEFVRVTVWDSCFHAGYARMAGGLTPRLQLVERFKNHYHHKFVSFPRNWGVTACSGCGRCIDACMGRIDKRDCLHQLETRWIPSETLGDLS